MSASITRRGVLTGAAALAGMTALPKLLNAAAIGHLVVDERLADSAAFAAGFDAPRIHRVNALDDLCNRWYTRMRREVLADTRQIAGLTSWMDYIIMRDCAAEVGYRRAFHAEHLLQPESSPAWAHDLGRLLSAGSHPRHAIAAHVAPGDRRMVTWVFSPRSV